MWKKARGGDREEELEAGDEEKGEEDAESLPQDVKEDLESEGELGEQAFELKLRKNLKALTRQVQKSAQPQKLAKAAPLPKKKAAVRPASRKPAKPKKAAKLPPKKSARKPAPKKRVRKASR